jgi:hypothetical protein
VECEVPADLFENLEDKATACACDAAINKELIHGVYGAKKMRADHFNRSLQILSP